MYRKPVWFVFMGLRWKSAAQAMCLHSLLLLRPGTTKGETMCGLLCSLWQSHSFPRLIHLSWNRFYGTEILRLFQKKLKDISTFPGRILAEWSNHILKAEFWKLLKVSYISMHCVRKSDKLEEKLEETLPRNAFPLGFSWSWAPSELSMLCLPITMPLRLICVLPASSYSGWGDTKVWQS